MGKVRIKKSTRVHIKSAQFNFVPDDNAIKLKEIKTELYDQAEPTLKMDHVDTNLENNPFRGIKIKDDVLKQELIYEQPLKKELKLNVVKPKKKKDRLKLKRKMLLEKLEAGAATKFKEKELKKIMKKAAQRAKTPIVGDMNLLKLALPDLPTQSKQFAKREKSLGLKKENNSKNTSKRKQHQGLKDIKHFQKLLKKKKSQIDIKSLILSNMKEKCA